MKKVELIKKAFQDGIFINGKKRRAKRTVSYRKDIESKISGSQKTKGNFSEEEIELLNFIANMIVDIVLKETGIEREKDDSF